MKTIIALLMFVSTGALAGDPHAWNIVPKLLNSAVMKKEIAKYPNYYFQSLVFEQSDNGWTEHTFTLTLAKHDWDQAGPERICFWVDYWETEKKNPVREPHKFDCKN